MSTTYVVTVKEPKVRRGHCTKKIIVAASDGDTAKRLALVASRFDPKKAILFVHEVAWETPIVVTVS